MAIVFGLFADKAAAERAAAELRSADGHPTFAVQTHERSPLDGNYLPEAATEIGRNTMVAIVVGGVGGLILGSIAGATLDIVGLTVGIGAGFGFLTGILSGMLGGMMAGTRRPKPALREAAEQLGGGRVLLTVEVDDPGHVDLVEQLLEGHAGESVGRC